MSVTFEHLLENMPSIAEYYELCTNNHSPDNEFRCHCNPCLTTGLKHEKPKDSVHRRTNDFNDQQVVANELNNASDRVFPDSDGKYMNFNTKF